MIRPFSRIGFGLGLGLLDPFRAFSQAEFDALPNKWASWRAQDATLSGSSVLTIPDNSGNSRTMTATGNPQYVASAINGLPAVQFNATNKLATAAQTMSSTSAAIFTVIKSGTALTVKYALKDATASSHFSLAMYYYARAYLNLSQPSNNPNATTLAGTSVPVVMTARLNSTGQAYCGQNGQTCSNIDARVPYPNVVSTFSGFTSHVLEMGTAHDDLIAEIHIFSPAPDNTTCNRIDKFLADKYSITLSRPTKSILCALGDSNTDFTNAGPIALHPLGGWPERFQGLVGASLLDIYNYGVTGSLALNINATIQRDVDSARWHPCARNNICGILGMGTNDMIAYATPTGFNQTTAESKKLKTFMEGAGWRMARIPMISLGNYGSAPPETQRLAVEADVDSNQTLYASSTALCPSYASLLAGVWGGTNDGTNWANTYHVNDAGELVIAQAFQTMCANDGITF